MEYNYQKLVSLLNEYLGVDPKRITPDASLTEDLGLDSLDALDLLRLANDTYHIMILPEDLMQIDSVEDLHHFILDRLESNREKS